MPSPLKCLTLSLACLLAGSFVTAQEEIAKITYPKVRDTSAMVESVFGKAARQGALPFRITIRNNSGADRLWVVTLKEGNSSRKLSTESRFQFAVKNGTEIQEDVIFHFAPAFLAYDYRNLEVTITANGLDRFSRSNGDQTNKRYPKLALSKPIAQRNITKLNDLVKKDDSQNHYFGHSFEAGYLPTNWIGYSALDGLLIDVDSLAEISTAQLQALRTWVRFGGNLEIFFTDEDELGKIPKTLLEEPNLRKSTDVSLGRISVRKWNGSVLDSRLISKSGPLLRSYKPRDKSLSDDFSNNWQLQKRFGIKTFNPVFVFVLLLLFAILVAPVNLFVFAKKGRRHRLFITTPIISLAACVILIAAIFLMDGLGGTGLRAIFADLQPGRNEMRLYTTQEQISRTGVMINQGFETEIPYDINPVDLPSSTYNPFSRSGSQSTLYEIVNTVYQGGFFRSRSEQGFAIRAAAATRSRIESAGFNDGIPVLTSALDTGLKELFYRDENGKAWSLPPNTTVASGSQIPLQEITDDEFEEWLFAANDVFDATLKEQIKTLGREPNRFFAKVLTPEAFALPTHPGIEWEDTQMLLTGTPLEKGNLTDPEAGSPTSTNE
ncbi:MAG: hypothetical protein P1U86_10185 [Verrucomicrobiales bacterium]|nr:hypothetical protein [Verrucomicrobiales bacterium]